MVEMRRGGKDEWTDEGKPKGQLSRGDGVMAPREKRPAHGSVYERAHCAKPGGTAGDFTALVPAKAGMRAFLFNSPYTPETIRKKTRRQKHEYQHQQDNSLQDLSD